MASRVSAWRNANRSADSSTTSCAAISSLTSASSSRFVVLGERLQQLEIEPPSGNRRHGRHSARGHRERGEPTPYRFDRRFRNAHPLQRPRPPSATRRREIAGNDQCL